MGHKIKFRGEGKNEKFWIFDILENNEDISTQIHVECVGTRYMLNR